MKKTIPLLVGIWLSAGCTSVTTSNYMAFDTVEYISEFPVSVTLPDPKPCNWDIMGATDFVIFDSLVVFATNRPDGYWSFHSLSDGSKLGQYLLRGNGPTEFMFSPILTKNTTFYRTSDSLYACISDINRSRIYRMNISGTLENNSLDLITEKDSAGEILFACLRLDDGVYLTRTPDPHWTKQDRMIREGDQTMVTRNFEILNRAHIDQGEDINILAAGIQVHCDGNTVVEMPVGLNQINIYALDDSFGKTISVGKKLDNIDEIQTRRKANRMETYGCLRLYPGFFGALYINEDIRTYQTRRKKLPVIHLFDYDGAPLAELKLKKIISSFDIDIARGKLYTLDYASEGFDMYDIGNILMGFGGATDRLQAEKVRADAY